MLNFSTGNSHWRDRFLDQALPEQRVIIANQVNRSIAPSSGCRIASWADEFPRPSRRNRKLSIQHLDSACQFYAAVNLIFIFVALFTPSAFFALSPPISVPLHLAAPSLLAILVMLKEWCIFTESLRNYLFWHKKVPKHFWEQFIHEIMSRFLTFKKKNT